MANASAWASQSTALDAGERAAAVLRRITEKPTSIVILRGTPKAALTAQTVRLEYDSQKSLNEQAGAAGRSSQQRVTVFGIRGHATEADTNIRRDDQFTADGLLYRVVSVVLTIGEIQAKCEALG